MKSLFSDHMNLTAKVMDMRLERQNVVMSNMANIRTPGYKPRRLEFEEDLQKALGLDVKGKMAVTDRRHTPMVFNPDSFDADWHKEFKPRTVHGEDRVDLDKEMAHMAKNTMMYNALATVLKKNFTGLSTIITEAKS
jgi:flagellar basal-body rod protein FlgB